MTTIPTDGARDMVSLEAHAEVARNVLACAFSTSDEYEQALISQRRAEGRYAPQRDWLAIACGIALVTAAGTAFFMV